MKILALALASVLAAGSCSSVSGSRTTITPSDNQITRTHNVRSFDAIEASRVKVVYTPGPATGTVTVTAPDNVMPYVQVRVDDGTLECEIDNDVQLRRNDRSQVVITVTAPDVDDFEASLSGIIEITGNLNIREFSASASTSGSISAPAVTVSGEAELEAGTSGSVSIRTLTAGKVDFDATTSGSISVATLSARKVGAEATTSGSVTVSGGTTAEADYEAGTSGSLTLDGLTAETGSASASTAGTVRCRILRPSDISTSTGGSVNNSTN